MNDEDLPFVLVLTPVVNADIHRDGLIWPAFRYGLSNSRIRTDPEEIGRAELGEVETEGLAIMANDTGVV